MKTLNEVSAIILCIVFLFGGLGVMLNAELLNGVIIIGLAMMIIGIAIGVWIFKETLRGK